MANSWDTNQYYKKTKTDPAKQKAAYQGAAWAQPTGAIGALIQGNNGVYNKHLIDTYRKEWGAANNPAPGTGALPAQSMYTGGGGGGRGGGGGGGGGGPAGMTQAQLDWIAKMLAGGAPKAQVAGPGLNLPDTKFDPTMYNELEKRFGQGVAQSRTAANTAYGNLQNYLTSNYKNAFAGGPPPMQQTGMDQASMGRMLQAQGVDPSLAAGNAQAAAAANAGFGNIWGLLGANEDTAQRNRLNRVQTDRGTTQMAIDAANLQGMTGIGLQRGQAQSEWQARADQAAQQEAMANWQRGNTVSDTNYQGSNQYRNQMLQALLGLVPNLGKLNLPDLKALGLGLMDEEEFWAYLEELSPEEQEQALYDFGYAGANELPGQFANSGYAPSLGYSEFDVGTYGALPDELNKQGEVMPWGLDQEAQAYNALQDVGSMTMDNALAMYGGPGAYDVSAFQDIESPMGQPLDMSDARYLDSMVQGGTGYEAFLARMVRDEGMSPGAAVAALWETVASAGEDEVDPQMAADREALKASMPPAMLDAMESRMPGAGTPGDLSTPSGRAATYDMKAIQDVANDLFERKSRIPDAGYQDPETGMMFAGVKRTQSPAAKKYAQAGIPTPDETYMDEEWLNAPIDPAEMEAWHTEVGGADRDVASQTKNVDRSIANIDDLKDQMTEWERLQAEGPEKTGPDWNPYDLSMPSLEAARTARDLDFEELASLPASESGRPQWSEFTEQARGGGAPTGFMLPEQTEARDEEYASALSDWEASNRRRLTEEAMERGGRAKLGERQPYAEVTEAGEVRPLFDFGEKGEENPRAAVGARNLLGKLGGFLPGMGGGFEVERLDKGLLGKAERFSDSALKDRNRAFAARTEAWNQYTPAMEQRAAALGRAAGLMHSGRSPTSDILMQRAMARRMMMGR